MSVVAGYVVPNKPQPLLAPEQNAGWGELRRAYEEAARRIAALEPDLLVLYSTGWPSVIGHQIQADPEPRWVHVDPEWHDLGEMSYAFRMDAAFGDLYRRCAAARGLHARTVAYEGFPIDTGSIVALQLLNPDNAIPASIVSCNMYADRAETLVLGKAAADAVEAGGKRAVAVAVTALSNRLFTEPIEPARDAISSLKDDEWNHKILQFLAEGRLEDVSQLARQFTREANGDSKLKAIWWLAGLMGQHNRYRGEVLAYRPVWGSGAAVVALIPSGRESADQEFDEDDVDVYHGERSVLGGQEGAEGPEGPEALGGPEMGWGSEGADVDAGADDSEVARSLDAPNERAAVGRSAGAARPVFPPRPTRGPNQQNQSPQGSLVHEAIRTDAAPKPVGPYPHARRVGDLLYLSGIGPRQPGTGAIPGGPVRDATGARLGYDVAAQTRATIENIRAILEAAGSSLDRVFDVTVFLIDMDRDFATFNRVYGELFLGIDATRTTVEVRALPTPIAVELKVIARP